MILLGKLTLHVYLLFGMNNGFPASQKALTPQGFGEHKSAVVNRRQLSNGFPSD